ncbi:MAG: DUF1461 domain-containing protein [Gammaproteobacteria bacterium]|nr:DUF1461 domain-containing protein [Gammaproteobacteria bacterium]
MARKRQRKSRSVKTPPGGKIAARPCATASEPRRNVGALAAFSWGGLFVCSFLAALFIAWHLLAQAHFFYGIWYDVLAIDKTVAEYGPGNRNRDGFGGTDKREHQRLFAAIVIAIHDDGAGLESLEYRDPQNNVLGTFLTEAEIVHLRDVAALVSKVNVLGTVVIAVVLALLALIVVQSLPPPSLPRFHVAAAVVITAVIALTLNFGAEKTFYAMHAWVFPPDHQWFFYYRDSLMSTFMQAPNLFGYIALVLAGLALLLYIAWIVGLTRALRRRARRIDPIGLTDDSVGR